MPDKVRFVSPRNSADYDRLVTDLLAKPLGTEQPYGGCTSQERADEVRAKTRTAARKQGYSCKAYWRACDKPGQCEWGADCTHHVLFTLYDPGAARNWKAQQAQQRSK